MAFDLKAISARVLAKVLIMKITIFRLEQLLNEDLYG
ncbi:MAG: hypothetical protein RLZZ490_799 [Cyanobacteriota bacterium]